MAHKLADRVKESTTSTGTGTINLGGASSGFRTFVAGIGTGNTCPYAIIDSTNGTWEVGIGTVTDATPDTLSRDTVLASSNANALVNFAAGTKDVFCTRPADRFGYLYDNGALALKATNPASAVNYIDVQGAVTSGDPFIAAEGSDTNVDLLIKSKGTGSIIFNTGGGNQAVFTNVANAVNTVEFRGGPTGNAAHFRAGGSDSNVDLWVASKGSSSGIWLAPNDVAALKLAPVASGVNYLQFSGAAASSAPAIAAVGSDTNIGITMTPKGFAGVNCNWTEIVKTADQDVTNSATLTNDTQLTFSCTSGKVYHVELLLVYAGNNATGDYKFNFTLPTAQGWHCYVGSDTAADAIMVTTGIRFSAAAAFAADIVLGTDASLTPRTLSLEMMFTAGATSACTFKFANSAAAGGRTSRTCAGTRLRWRQLN